MSRQTQLPAFRIRQFPQGSPNARDASTEDGLVRIRRLSYDSLLNREPQAALIYVDDDDGEQVTVGSGFELSQRLSDPFTPAIEQWNRRTDHSSLPATHAFDVIESANVKSAWQPYVTPRHISVDDSTDNILLSERTSSPGDKTPVGSLTPLGKQQVKEAAACLFRASRNPPSTKPDVQSTSSPHTDRWAAYGSSPNSLSSSSPEQKATPLITSETSSPAPEQSVKRPLLALFEAELAKLVQPSPDVTLKNLPSNVAPTQDDHLPPLAASHPATVPPAQTQPAYQSSQTQTIPAAAKSPRELITGSLQSVMDGINLMTASGADIGNELREIAKSAPQGFVDFVGAQIRSKIETPPAANIDPVPSKPDQRSLHKKKAQRLIEELQSFMEDEAETPMQETQPVSMSSSQSKAPSASAKAPQAPMKAEQAEKPLPKEPESPVLPGKTQGSDAPRCSDLCLYGCDNPACAVKAAVKEAYERLFPQSAAEKPTKQASFTVPQHFKVDKLLARRYISYDSLMGARKKQYLVRWVRRGAEEDVWYDVESLVHCKELVSKFDRAHPEPELAGFLPTPPLQSVAQEADLTQLHSRAADRMVTFQPPQVSRQPEQDCQAQPASHRKEPYGVNTAKAIKFETEKPKPIWAEPKRDLRHRRSWHPLSKATVDETSFDFSPMDVMKKYPPVSLLHTSSSNTAASSSKPSGTDKPAPEPNLKNVSFSASRPAASETKSERFSAIEHSLQDARPTHQVDPTLYAPPSPVLTAPRRLAPTNTLPYDATREASNAAIRRVRSLSFKPTANMHPDERMVARYDERHQSPSTHDSARDLSTSPLRHAKSVSFHPASRPEPGTSNADHRPINFSLRRANTTATAEPSQAPQRRHVAQLRTAQSEAETRRNNVAHCTFRLAYMGFPQREAAIVSETVSGDLESALDVLNEDVRAHDEFQRRQSQRRSWAGESSGRRMPGEFAWNSQAGVCQNRDGLA